MTVAASGTCGRDDHSSTINLTVARARNPIAELTLGILSSSSPTLVPTGNIGFAGNGTARTMTVSAVDERSGTELTVTVSDGQNSGSVQVRVMVGGGNGNTLTEDSEADLLLAQSNNDTLTGEDNDLLYGDSGSASCPAAQATTAWAATAATSSPSRSSAGSLQRQQRHRHGRPTSLSPRATPTTAPTI